MITNRWRKTRGKDVWTNGDYTIECRETGLTRFTVYGPPDPEPPHYRRMVGGTSSLAVAKSMARRHAWELKRREPKAGS